MLFAAGQGTLTAFSCSLVLVSAMSGLYFANAGYGFLQFNSGNCPFSGGGSFTGQRYLATQNGIMQSLGGGANYFPGTIAGATNTGGQYS